MFTETPRLRRRLVGYSRKDVQQALAHHEAMVRTAQQGSETARSSVAQLQTEVEQIRHDLAAKEQQIQALQAQAGQLSSEAEQQRIQADGYRQQSERYRVEAEHARQEADAARQEIAAAQAPDRIAGLLNEELARILAAAQESAERIVEKAEQTSAQRVALSEVVWEDVQAEIARFVGWWKQVEPIIQDLHTRIRDARTRADEVAERIRDALSPTLQAMIDVDGRLARLESEAVPPELKAPAAIRGQEPEAESEETAAGAQNGDASTVVRIEEPVPSESTGDVDGYHRTEFRPWG